MPTLGENLKVWNGVYPWPSEGDEWSQGFGGTEALWWFILYPRIHRFLPAPAILEIAPGYGRWTQFLKNQCQSLIAVDMSPKCIDHCKTRFAGDSHIQLHLNDGSSLSMVPDHSIDFVFSFDSLVHAESDVLRAYLIQLTAKLKPNGAGFLHHSNLGAYPRRLAFLNAYRRLPAVLRARVIKEARVEAMLSLNLQAWRSTSMTAKLFRSYCQEAGLRCISQELINWGYGKCLIDALSVFTPPNSPWDTKSLNFKNDQFVEGTSLTSRLSELYCR